MPKVELTIRVDKLVEEVFDALTDPDLAHRWSGTVNSATAHGPIDEGQTFTVEASFLGKSLDMDCEVTEYDRPRRYTYRSERPLKMTMSSRFTEADGATEVSTTVDVDPGMLFAAVGPLFKRRMRKQLEGDLERFKELLES